MKEALIFKEIRGTGAYEQVIKGARQAFTAWRQSNTEANKQAVLENCAQALRLAAHDLSGPESEQAQNEIRDLQAEVTGKQPVSRFIKEPSDPFLPFREQD